METIPALLARRARTLPDGVLLDDSLGIWNFADAFTAIGGVAQRLYSLGVTEGTVVAVLPQTNRQQALYELAVLCLGGAVVDFPDGIPPDGAELARQLDERAVHLLLLSSAAQHQMLAPHLDELYDLVHLFAIEPIAGLPQLQPAEADVAALLARIAKVSPSQDAWIEAQTGEVLRHEQVARAQQALPLHAADRRVMCLPAWSRLSRMALYRFEGGVVVREAALEDALLAEQPTVLLTTPASLSAWWSGAREELGAMGWMLLRWGMSVGRQDGSSRRLRAQQRLAEPLVLQPTRERLGGTLKQIVCEPEASDAIQRRFAGLGVSISAP
ncbi:MAG: hypothetical protein AAFV53_42470 [Myxococcota bacterium]